MGIAPDSAIIRVCSLVPEAMFVSAQHASNCSNCKHMEWRARVEHREERDDNTGMVAHLDVGRVGRPFTTYAWQDSPMQHRQ